MEKTYNPITASTAYDNNFFAKIPFPPPGFSTVLTSDQDVPLLIYNNSVPTKERIRKGKYNWMTQVDMRPHDIAFEAELLSKDNISKFHVAINMTAKVENPDQVSLDNVTDVTAAVKSSMLPELQYQANLYLMEDIQAFREALSATLGIAHLASGIQLSNIRLQINPDRKYVEEQEALRQLQRKKIFETARAEVAQELSELYDDPVKQVFAEFATDRITVEEAADRLRAKDAASFDETLRRATAYLGMFKSAQDIAVVSPEVLDDKAKQLFTLMLNEVGSAPGNAQKRALEAKVQEQALFAPPED